MNQVDAVAVGMTRKDLQSTRLRRAGVAGTRSAMLLLAAAGALAGARVARADGAVVAWGYNSNGQCTTPPGIGVVTAIAAKYSHTVALKADGAVVAWGDNGYGQCTTPSGLGVVTAIAAGFYHTVALKADGAVVAWGNNSYTPPGIGVVTAVAAGAYHTVALQANGAVIAWGYNNYGQCTTPPGIGVVTAITAGWSHTVALKANGAVVAWGDNNYGQCTTPSGIGVATAIAAGAGHTVALKANGAVVAWGDNGQGQCTTPQGLGVVTAIAAGTFYTVALKADGAVVAWGDNGSGQCTTPQGLGVVTAIAAGESHTVAIFKPAAVNLRTSVSFPLLTTAILDAQSGDTLLVYPWTFIDDDIDYRGKSIELRSTNGVSRGASSTTLFADGARLSAPELIEIAGTVTVPTSAGVTISTDAALSFSGNTFISPGGSILAQNDGSPVTLAGSCVLASDAVFNALAPIELTGSLDLLGGVVVATSLTTSAASDLISVNGTVDVDTLTLGGDATCLNSAIVSNVTVNGGAQLAASGEVVGALDNAGRVISTDDLVVVGDVHNSIGGSILAQVGVLYITGDLINEGTVYGNVITAPGYAGGGTGGTQAGDGIRIAGSVQVGAFGELRFVEELWKFSLCGDMSLACAPSGVRFNGAELSFDGCAKGSQKLEATSRDFGCVAEALSGEDANVSLFGELAIVSGTTVELVDDFDNATGKGAEAIYTKGLHVSAGATLITNGVMVYAEIVNIEGTVDNRDNICELPDVPDADINDDGLVNAIDLAYVLTYWGSGTAIADLNRDGIVGAADLTIVLGGWTG